MLELEQQALRDDQVQAAAAMSLQDGLIYELPGAERLPGVGGGGGSASAALPPCPPAAEARAAIQSS
jgi:hypothetical protein